MHSKLLSKCTKVWQGTLAFYRAAWTDEEALCMKRDALIACLEAAKELHSKLWAGTSVEIAFEVSSAKQKATSQSAAAKHVGMHSSNHFKNSKFKMIENRPNQAA